MNYFSQLAPAFFSAFFGATAAFTFNAVGLRLREREKRLATVNYTIYALILTLEKLCNFKKQFLIEHTDDFASALTELKKYDPTGTSQTTTETLARVGDIFQRIKEEDPTYNGAFKVWQESDFLTLPQTDGLSFTVQGAPDLLRLLVLVSSETGQITTRIKLKNARRQVLTDAMLPEIKAGQPSDNTILFWYEMLDLRHILLQHTNTALVAADVALEQLNTYRSSNFRRRSKLFQRVSGKTPWTTYSMVDGWEKLIPNREEYRRIIGQTTTTPPRS